MYSEIFRERERERERKREIRKWHFTVLVKSRIAQLDTIHSSKQHTIYYLVVEGCATPTHGYVNDDPLVTVDACTNGTPRTLCDACM